MLSIKDPVFTIPNNFNQIIRIYSKLYTQDISSPQVANMEGLSISLLDNQKELVTLTSERGYLNSLSKIVELYGNVLLKQKNKYEIQSQNVQVDLQNSLYRSNTISSLETGGFKVSSQAFLLSQPSGILTLSEKVHSLFYTCKNKKLLSQLGNGPDLRLNMLSSVNYLYNNNNNYDNNNSEFDNKYECLISAERNYEIEANQMSINYIDEHKIIYTGNVIVTKGITTLKASSVTIYLKESDLNFSLLSQRLQDKILKVQVEGNVSYTSDDELITGEKAIFEPANKTATFIGKVTQTPYRKSLQRKVLIISSSLFN